MINPQLGTAKWLPLEDQLNGVYGQACLSIQIDRLNWDLCIGNSGLWRRGWPGPEPIPRRAISDCVGLSLVGDAQFTFPMKLDIRTSGDGT
jgi:hypothetical protein